MFVAPGLQVKGCPRYDYPIGYEAGAPLPALETLESASLYCLRYVKLWAEAGLIRQYLATLRRLDHDPSAFQKTARYDLTPPKGAVAVRYSSRHLSNNLINQSINHPRKCRARDADAGAYASR
jgi:hypothetical protein